MVLKHRKQIIDNLRETKVSPLMLDIQYGFYYAKIGISFIHYEPQSGSRRIL